MTLEQRDATTGIAHVCAKHLQMQMDHVTLFNTMATGCMHMELRKARIRNNWILGKLKVACAHFDFHASETFKSSISGIGNEFCTPTDNDSCLQRSPGWGSYHTCSESTDYCTTWGKDMRRCCPDACGTGGFTVEDCIGFVGSGACIYPNLAQCTLAG